MEKNLLSRRGFVGASAGLGVALAACGLAGTALAADKGASASADKKAASAAKDGVVIDYKGREVAIPEKIERIAVTCMGGATQTVCVFGGADRLVVSPSMAKSSPLVLKLFPQIENAVDAGTFDDVNIETLAAADPDFAFVSSTSDKGNAAIEELGIPTYTLGTANSTIESMRNDYVNAGKLLGTSDVADDLMKFWDDVLGYVADTLETIPEDQRLTVYRCGAELTAASHTPWATTWIKGAGGIPAVEKDGMTSDVSIEQVAAWDPDVISTSGDVDAILTNEAYADLKAVKNGAVYKTPKGTMSWDVPSPEVPLGFAWLAKTLYPETFADLDVEAKCKEFYAQFFNYDLTGEDLDGIFLRK